MAYVSVPGCTSLSLKGRPRKRKGLDGSGSDQHNHLSESWMDRMKVCLGVCSTQFIDTFSIETFRNTKLMAKQDVLRIWTNGNMFCYVTLCFLFWFYFDVYRLPFTPFVFLIFLSLYCHFCLLNQLQQLYILIKY